MNSPGTCSCMKPRESPWPLSSSTSRAPGCQVRTMILSPCWWGPRNAKGSPCSARISACTWAASIRSSTALPLSIVILHEGFAQLYQPSQGHIQPLWPVAGFVRNLVGGLLDTEQRQRCLFSIVLLPDMVQTGCGLPVGFEKRLHRLFPVSFTDDRPGLLSRLRLLGAMEAAQGCGCRIIEGAQQSADVLVRTVALTPLLQWPRWLALEVNEADITGQHLAYRQRMTSVMPAQQVITAVIEIAGKGQHSTKAQHPQRIAAQRLAHFLPVGVTQLQIQQDGYGDQQRQGQNRLGPALQSLEQRRRGRRAAHSAFSCCSRAGMPLGSSGSSSGTSGSSRGVCAGRLPAIAGKWRRKWKLRKVSGARHQSPRAALFSVIWLQCLRDRAIRWSWSCWLSFGSRMNRLASRFSARLSGSRLLEPTVTHSLFISATFPCRGRSQYSWITTPPRSR